MLAFRYTKMGSAVYLSHLDMLRLIVRTLRRGGIPAAYSEGFNPHMLLHLSAPLPLGIASVAEYGAVDANASPEELKAAFAVAAPVGVACGLAARVDKNPNFAGISHSAEYRIELAGLSRFAGEVEGILQKQRFDVEYFSKGGRVVKDVRGEILGLRFEGEALIAELRCGNVNLRADRFAYNLARIHDLDASPLRIVKLRHFMLRGEEISDMERILTEG